MPQLVERLENLVPPQVLAKEKGEPAPPPQPNPQEQMMQMEMAQKQAEIQHKQQLADIEAQELKLRQQRDQLEVQRLQLQAQEMQERMRQNQVKEGVDLHKANLSYNADVMKIAADLHKHRNPQPSNNK